MECACFDADVDDYSTVLEDKMVKARRPHLCGECLRVIEHGEMYRREKTVHDGTCSTHKTCIDCSSIRDNLVCSFFWGGVLELVHEGISDCRGNISESVISKLTPRAREWVCERIESYWEWEESDDQ